MNQSFKIIAILVISAIAWTASVQSTLTSETSDKEEFEISGTVHDANSGEAISGATVTLNGEQTKETDEYGEFLFDDLEEGNHTLTVDAEGYHGTERSVEISEESVAVVVDLYPEEDDK